MAYEIATGARQDGVPGTGEAERVASVDGLSVTFRRGGRDIHALRGVSLGIGAGEIVGLVGESGSGKSVLGLSLLGLLPGSPRTSGRVTVRGQDMFADAEAARRMRRDHLGAVFQDPMTSLNPTMRVGHQIAEAAGSGAEAVRLLRAVGVPDPERRLTAFPHQLSGGLRQRVMIAMAVAGSPALVVADEPTTALDVTVQAQVLALVRALRDEIGCSFLLITHDLGVAAQVADRVAVMYGGRIAELGPTEAILEDAAHPYTLGLMRSRLSLNADRLRPLATLPGEVPDPGAPPPGCPFEPRCPLAVDACTSEPPDPEPVAPSHLSACIRAADVRAGLPGEPRGDATRTPAGPGAADPPSSPVPGGAPGDGTKLRAAVRAGPPTEPRREGPARAPSEADGLAHDLTPGSAPAPGSAPTLGSASGPAHGGASSPASGSGPAYGGASGPAPGSGPARGGAPGSAPPAGSAGGGARAEDGADGRVAVRAQDVVRTFGVKDGPGRRARLAALRGVDLEVGAGESVAIVGESGSGKSTLLRIIAGLDRADGGGVGLGPGGRPQMVFQDAGASLTPWMTVGDLIGERLRGRRLSRTARRERTVAALAQAELPAEVAGARAAQLSGGQRQRVALARATVVPPEILLCDEPTSALDVSLAASVINLIGRLRRELGMAVLFVTHDLSVARIVADRIAVMYLGRIVELGPAAEVVAAPRHPYTKALVAAVPTFGVEPAALTGEPASPLRPPTGCAFHPRCPYAEDACADPDLEPRLTRLRGEPDRTVACIRAEAI